METNVPVVLPHRLHTTSVLDKTSFEILSGHDISRPESENTNSTEQFSRQKLKLLREKTTLAAEASDCTNPAHLFKAACIQRIRKQKSRSKLTVCEVLALSSGNKETQSNGQIERIKLEALYQKMNSKIKKLDKEATEIRSRCQTCRQIDYKLAERDFVKRKIHLLTNPSVEHKVQEQLYERDPLTLLGEVVNSCIRPSTTSEDVWRKLREKCTERNTQTLQ